MSVDSSSALEIDDSLDDGEIKYSQPEENTPGKNSEPELSDVDESVADMLSRAASFFSPALPSDLLEGEMLVHTFDDIMMYWNQRVSRGRVHLTNHRFIFLPDDRSTYVRCLH